MLNTDVDTYFKCVVSCWDPSVPHLEGAEQFYIDAAREHGLEIWATARMNDVHDAHWPAEIFNAVEPDPVELDFKKLGWEHLTDQQKELERRMRPQQA